MTFRSDTGYIGHPPITDISTTAKVPVGTIICAHDDDGGGAAEFIYLQGVASTVAGDVVEYNSSFQSGLSSIAITAPAEPLAVAMAACTASYYGWYQISGLATVAKGSGTSFAADAGLGATSGKAVAVASGLIVNGAVVASAASGASAVTTVSVMLNRPHAPADVS
jgi:hypothetical protein